MKLIGWMVLGCAGALGVTLGATGGRWAGELVAGMLAPLAASGGTWVLMERTYRRRPERLMAVSVGAFGAKLVFFGGYVSVALGLAAFSPVPFVVSFTGSFIALHLVEALAMRRLFSGGPDPRL
ncbi:MAG: hypothetical protein FJW23_16620 [Acidimicrobiia bacterium]|nr:hypothetical protein [Acidimicrobiia bacterium]